MNIKKFFDKITSCKSENTSALHYFIKTGICILSAVCFASVAIALTLSSNSGIASRQAMSSLISEKKLPIYCVDTDKPKIALSFDAAWGNIRLMEDYYDFR